MSVVVVVLTPKQIEKLIEKGGKMLRALSRKLGIRQAFATVGYTEADHQEGWQLYLWLVGYRPGKTSPALTKDEAELAILVLDGWDNPNFKRARAALRHLHPEQEAYIFDGLEAQEGIASVAAVQTFVTRARALREAKDPAREKTREADRAAIATLYQRGILSQAKEEELLGLVAKAQKLSPTVASDAESLEEKETQEVARKFKAWYDDWRASAMTAITRRDYLISLGFAARRESEADEEEPTEGTQPAEGESKKTVPVG